MKKQLILIAKSITVFILLIFCAVVIDARAEDYLWEPTLAWEDPSPGIGHKLLNNDEWLIYYADNKVQLRELATGKKLAESEDLLQLLELKKCDAASFSMSNDGEKIYGIFTYYRGGPMVIFDSKTLKVIKRIKINNPGVFGTQYSLPDGSSFFILGSLSGYFVTSDDFRIVCETKYDYGNHWPSPGEPVKPNGTCIISFNPNSTDELNLDNKDSYKMLFYNETQFNLGFKKHNFTYIKDKVFHYLDPITMKVHHSNEYYFTVSPKQKFILQELKEKVEVLDYNTKDVIKTYSFDELCYGGKGSEYNTLINELYSDDKDLVFNNLTYIRNPSCYSAKHKKKLGIYPSKYKDLFSKNWNKYSGNMIQLSLNDNRNYLIRNHPMTQVYSLEDKSEVVDDSKNDVIKTDSINAYISIPDGKYPYFMSIYTSDGKLVEEVKEPQVDNNYILYNIENLSNGIYIITIKFEDGSSQSFKFVKGK